MMNDLEKTDEFFCAKIETMRSIVENNHYPKFSAFIDGRQRALADQILRRQGATNFQYFGGSEHSERVLLGIYPDYMDVHDLEWPMNILHFTYNKNYDLSHRDFLGALMSLQIKREMIGDIHVASGIAEIAVHENMLDFVQNNVIKIGNVGVSICVSNEMTLDTILKFQEISGTVSSIRIDAVVALLTRLSRTKACGLITAGKVVVNFLEVKSQSLQLNPNDVITIRGYGKFILSDDVRMTKKNRFHIIINKYL